MISERRIILRNAGKTDPEKIDDYISSGGYLSASRAISMSPGELIEVIIKSGLRGRGGAGFSTGLKAKYTNQAKPANSQKYLVCNADEGEPGTFKDRIIMESDPHLLVEGMIIAAYSIGASKAFIYLRGEYFRSICLVNMAIQQSIERGYLGKNIFGSDFSLDIEVKPGAGSYLCGEELTLLESLEGKRGCPRIKPPFPAEKGLFNCPTLVNNVETIANLPVIIEKGAEWFSGLGLKDTPGTKLFTISGDVANPGCFEVETGATLRDLIYGLAGGITGNKKFKAALLGGAAGTFIDESVLDTRAGFDSLKAIGATLGSGAIIVMDESRDILQMIGSIMRFFAHESCGKCVPCRVGTVRLTNIVGEIAYGHNDRKSGIDDMIKEAEYMEKCSLCPLGQSPVLPLRSLKRYFSNEI